MVGVAMAGRASPPATAAPTLDEGCGRDVDVGDTAVVAGERWPTAVSTCDVNQPSAVFRGGKAGVGLDPACAVRGPHRACRATCFLWSFQPSRVCRSTLRAYQVCHTRNSFLVVIFTLCSFLELLPLLCVRRQSQAGHYRSRGELCRTRHLTRANPCSSMIVMASLGPCNQCSSGPFLFFFMFCYSLRRHF